MDIVFEFMTNPLQCVYSHPYLFYVTIPIIVGWIIGGIAFLIFQAHNKKYSYEVDYEIEE